MNRLKLIASIAACLAGCSMAGCQQTTLQQVKEDAAQRWQSTQSRMMYAVALEQFKVGQLDQAASKTAESLSLDPNNLDARLLEGKIYIEQGRYVAAVADMKKVTLQLPQSSEACYFRAVAEEKAGQLDDALADYRKARDLDPKNSAAITAAAEVMVAMGQIHEAQAYVEGYVVQGSDDPGMYELAGRLAMMTEDPAEAARDFQQASDLDPHNLRYRECLAIALFRSGKHAEALETLRDLVKNPAYKCPAWVHAMRGDCYMALDHPVEAKDAYFAAKELQPTSAHAWLNLARASMALNDLPRTELAAQQAYSLDPGDLDTVLVLSYAMIRQGQGEKARALLERAAPGFPDSVLLQCLMGRAMGACGDNDGAARCYAAALKIQPENALARELLDRAAGAKS